MRVIPRFLKKMPKASSTNSFGAWTGYSRVVGLNWWHFGGGQSMSHRMRNSINKARLGGMPYK